jgi:hypothetical protein
MWWLCLLALAYGGPDSLLERRGEVPQPRRFSRIEEALPPRAEGRSPDGEHEAWVFSDRAVEHVRTFDGRRLSRVRHYDARGYPISTTHYQGDTPQFVVVHGRVEHRVGTETWVEHRLPGVVLRGPPNPIEASEAYVWPMTLGTFSARISGPADVLSDAFRDGLAQGCGCILVDRGTAYVDGRPGVRYLVRVPDPEAALVGELWAIPLGSATLFASYIAPLASGEFPGEDLVGPLAPGRAMLSLITVEKDR